MIHVVHLNNIHRQVVVCGAIYTPITRYSEAEEATS